MFSLSWQPTLFVELMKQKSGATASVLMKREQFKLICEMEWSKWFELSCSLHKEIPFL
jgi:hypothetical protein